MNGPLSKWLEGWRRPDEKDFSVPVPARILILVLAVSGATGFALGAIGYPSWQDAVEGAQVTAGLIDDPANTPFTRYEQRVWTAVHQVLAIFLLLGVSEHTLSILVSGALGAVSFMALASVVCAFSRRWDLALIAPCVILYCRGVEFGVSYPVLMMGYPPTYGIVARSWVILVLGLLAAGHARPSLLLAALSPAIHVVMGGLLWAALAVSLALGHRHHLSLLRKSWPYFATGASMALVSFLAHRLQMPEVRASMGVDVMELARAYIVNWDVHRRPVSMLSPGVALNLAFIVLALAMLISRESRLTTDLKLCLKTLLALSLAGLVFSAFTHVPVNSMPWILLMAMPFRSLNLVVLVFMALVLGLLGRRPGSAPLQFTLVGLLVVALSGERRELGFALLISGLLLAIQPFIPALSRSLGSLALRARQVAIILGAAFLLPLAWHAFGDGWNPPRGALPDRTSDPVLEAASRSPGALLVMPGLRWPQMRTRRPVLLSPHALDMLPYAPDVASDMDRILREVYLLDIRRSAPEGEGAVIPVGWKKAEWESRTEADWADLGNRFRFTGVLVNAGWTLKLPIEARNDRRILYGLPR